MVYDGLVGGMEVEYTVEKLARLAGVSARTLRYYDEIGLLHPARISSSGYRIYGETQVDTLQQILFYRELGMELSKIAETMKAEGFSRMAALRSHLQELQAQKARTERLIFTLQKTIEKEQGKRKMTNAEKFESFKKTLVQSNQEKYGQELAEKYGEETIRQSNAQMMGLTREAYEEMEHLGAEIQEKLEAAVKQGKAPEGQAGQEIFTLHRQWLGYTWASYQPEAHKGLGEMYTADERFTAHYDSQVSGCAAFLRDAIACFAEEGKTS